MSTMASLWQSIWRFHRLLAGILVLEYALTFAIVLTALTVLMARTNAIHKASGIHEQGLYVLQGRGTDRPIHRFQIFHARAMFATKVGQSHVAMGSSLPFFGAFSEVMSVSVPGDPLHRAPLQVNAYEGGSRLASVLGLRLLHGRWFHQDEIVRRYGDTTHLVILSQSLASRLFHDQNAVGKQVDIAASTHTVVGVIHPLAAPQYLGNRRTTYTMLLPRISNSHNLLLIRHQGPEANLDPVLAALRKQDAGKIHWSLTSYPAIRGKYFRSDRLTVLALAIVVVAVLLTALCGILGLTNYWVARRRPQIAIRRALGAKKRDIDRHFLMESGLLTLTGLLLGTVLQFFVNHFFMDFDAHTGLAMWVTSVILIMWLAFIVVYASLRRWQRMSPVEMMRRTSV